MELEKQNKTYVPTDAQINNQYRALAIAEKYGDTVEIVKSFDEQYLFEDIRKLYVKLLELENQYKPLTRTSEGRLTKSTLEYLANGGSSALAWCRLQLRSEGVLKSFTEDITDTQLNTEEKIPQLEIKVAKSLNKELMQVTYVAMKADFTDAHGDYTSGEEVRKAKESFNKALMKNQTMSNLFHMFETNTFDVIESFLAPADMSLNGHFVQKGDWLMTLQVNDDSLWSMIKDGDVVGISIGARAITETFSD